MFYELIIIPLITVILAQTVKLVTDDTKGNLNIIINVFGKYGGMPSTHTAYVTSLGVLLILKDGIESTAFAIWFLFSVIVIRNALGLRQEVSRHSVAIESVAKKTNTPTPKLTHRIGHKPIEVVAGFLFGLIVTLVIKCFV